MEKGILKQRNAVVRFSVLLDGAGRWNEFYYSIVPRSPEPVTRQLATIERAETAVLAFMGIDRESIVAKRFFSSDLMNHHPLLEAHKARAGTDFYSSLTEQPPANGVKLALLGLCLNGLSRKSRDGCLFQCDNEAGIRHIFIENLTDPASSAEAGVEQQTHRVFERLAEKLAAVNATVRENVLRTWIYAPHLDADYPGIVKARREFFDSIHLTQETHYIASTGIQGGAGIRFARVSLDAYAVAGIDPAGVRYIQAPEFMSPTHLYGVTFERATAARMGDRDFLFVSGTASIDRNGEIVHPGDVVKQTGRTLENISAILGAAGFSPADLSSMIVYLRDAADLAFVEPVLAAFAGDLTRVYVKAAVCRPGWLIEIEATAARSLS